MNRDEREALEMEKLKMKWVGERPLLMHNGQLANPLNKWTREIKKVAGIRKKTDDHFEELRRLEWFGGLYMDQANRICLPEDVVLGACVSGAKKSKNGEKAKAGIIGAVPFFRVEYDGPEDPLQLFKDEKFCDYRLVGVNNGRVMRARPRFDAWSVPVELLFDPDVIDGREVLAAAEACGQLVGVGDFTPRYGRFRVEA